MLCDPPRAIGQPTAWPAAARMSAKEAVAVELKGNMA
jgi:hypothetical protein